MAPNSPGRRQDDEEYTIRNNVIDVQYLISALQTVKEADVDKRKKIVTSVLKNVEGDILRGKTSKSQFIRDVKVLQAFDKLGFLDEEDRARLKKLVPSKTIMKRMVARLRKAFSPKDEKK